MVNLHWFSLKHAEFCSSEFKFAFLYLQIEHYLQVVKTEIVSRRSSQEYKLLEEYEYTAHSSLVHSLYIPVAKFHFEPSPMQVSVCY